MSPEALRPAFHAVLRHLQRGKALEDMVFFQDGSLVALDGTGYVSSKTMHGSSCLPTRHRDASITSAPQMVGGALRHPERRAVLPRMPEAILPQDGRKQHAWERHAATRFLAKWRHDPPHLTGMVTDEGLSAHAPPLDTLHEYGCHSSLGGKAGEQASLCAQVQAAAAAGGGTSYARHDRAAGLVPRGRCVHALPLNDARADVRVNLLA